MRRMIVAAVAAAAALVAGAAPAMAGSTPPVPRNATLACQIGIPGCTEPVFAVAATTNQDFNPAADEAMTYRTSDNTVRVRANNGLDNGTQDWAIGLDALVPASGPGDYGFTVFDNNHYAGRPVVHFEWAPFGQDTGLCAHVTVLHRMVLRACSGSQRQEFILARNIPAVNPPASLAYQFALVVEHVANLQRHLCVTGSESPPAQITSARCLNHSAGVATDQMMSFLP